MQVRQILVAALLATSAAGAMSQEIDPSETLQAKSLAARQAQVESAQAPTREPVAAQASQVPASGATTLAEHADGEAAPAVPKISWAKWRTNQNYAKAWLNGDRRQARKVLVAEHD